MASATRNEPIVATTKGKWADMMQGDRAGAVAADQVSDGAAIARKLTPGGSVVDA